MKVTEGIKLCEIWKREDGEVYVHQTGNFDGIEARLSIAALNSLLKSG